MHCAIRRPCHVGNHFTAHYNEFYLNKYLNLYHVDNHDHDRPFLGDGHGDHDWRRSTGRGNDHSSG